MPKTNQALSGEVLDAMPPASTSLVAPNPYLGMIATMVERGGDLANLDKMLDLQLKWEANRNAAPEDLEYGIDDAQMEVAVTLVKRDEVCELVIELHESLAFLSWVAGQDIPERHLRAFRALDSRARSIGKMVDECMERAA